MNSIWRNAKYQRFFASFTIGNIGDWFDIFALQIIFVHEFHATPILMSVLMLTFFIPGMILGPIAGWVADRIDQRNLMLVTDVTSGVLTGAILFSYSVWLVLALLVVRSVVVAFNSPAQQAYVKHIVDDGQLLSASSMMSIVFQLCKVLGPMLGAVVLLVASARACLAINMVSFLVSGLILFTLPKQPPETIATDDDVSSHWFASITQGARHIWQHRLLRIMVSLSVIWLVLSLMRQAQLAFYLKHILPERKDFLGVFMGLDGLGAVLTGILLSRKKTIRRFDLLMGVGFILLLSGAILLALFEPGWPVFLLVISALLIGFGSGINIVAYSYALKKFTPKALMGNVSGTASSLQMVAVSSGTVISGVIATLFNIHWVYWAIVVVMMLLTLGAFTLLRFKVDDTFPSAGETS